MKKIQHLVLQFKPVVGDNQFNPGILQTSINTEERKFESYLKLILRSTLWS